MGPLKLIDWSIIIQSANSIVLNIQQTNSLDQLNIDYKVG